MKSTKHIAVLGALSCLLSAPSFPMPPGAAELHSADHAFRKSHFIFPPFVPLLGQDLRVCAANGGKLPGAMPAPHFHEDTQVELRLLGTDGAELVAPSVKWLEPGHLALCFDVEGTTLTPSTGVSPGMVVAEVVVSGFNPTKGFAWVSMEVSADAGPAPISNAAWLIPVIGFEEPVTPGKFTAYRPQFYFRSEAPQSSTQVFGPFTLSADDFIELCVADAAQVPDSSMSLNFAKFTSRYDQQVEVYRADTLEPLLVRELSVPGGSGLLGGCFDEFGLADLALGGPDTEDTEIVVLILLHTSMPANSKSVPVATGKLTRMTAAGSVPMLLPTFTHRFNFGVDGPSNGQSN